MRILYLTIDAYSGYGGIAQYNKNTLRALSELPEVSEITAVCRYAPLQDSPEKIPEKITYFIPKDRRKLSFLRSVYQAIKGKKFDLIICAHLNLLQVALPLKWLLNCKVVTLIYGIEAWYPTKNRILNQCIKRVEHVISIRKLTYEKLCQSYNLKSPKWDFLANCIDPTVFFPQDADPEIVERYGLENHKVISITGRLDATPAGRYKGFDEVIELLPTLREEVPSIKCLIIGDGQYKSHLQEKADKLGVADLIEFTGYVSEAEKIELYRASDVFFMAGQNPKFDRYAMRFVLIEALACGLPFVASRPQDDADIFETEAAQFVNPHDQAEVKAAVLKAIRLSKPIDFGQLHQFFYPHFKENVKKIIVDRYYT